jgi:hypothetical protein
MQKINSAKELRDAILQLERKKADEEKMLREQFHLVCDSLKPINLIKSSFKEVIASGDLKNNILNTSIGLTVGYLSKILFERVSNSPIKKFLGTALLFGITNVVSKNSEGIKSMGNRVMKIISSKRSNGMNGTRNNETP